MTPDQLPDSLELRNRLRSLALLDHLVAPAKPAITFTPAADPHTQTATLQLDDHTTWDLLFTRDGATLTLAGPTTVTLASTLDQPAWQASDPAVQLPDLLDGTPESAQVWLGSHYGRRPDLLPIRQILMSVPLTVDLARELGSTLSWTAIRAAIIPIGYPIPDEDLPGPDNANSGANLE